MNMTKVKLKNYRHANFASIKARGCICWCMRTEPIEEAIGRIGLPQLMRCTISEVETEPTLWLPSPCGGSQSCCVSKRSKSAKNVSKKADPMEVILLLIANWLNATNISPENSFKALLQSLPTVTIIIIVSFFQRRDPVFAHCLSDRIKTWYIYIRVHREKAGREYNPPIKSFSKRTTLTNTEIATIYQWPDRCKSM